MREEDFVGIGIGICPEADECLSLCAEPAFFQHGSVFSDCARLRFGLAGGVREEDEGDGAWMGKAHGEVERFWPGGLAAGRRFSPPAMRYFNPPRTQAKKVFAKLSGRVEKDSPQAVALSLERRNPQPAYYPQHWHHFAREVC